MPVTDFECQIARGQIDRYLGGGLLSPAALSGLEEHLGECAECKSLVAERRAVLLGKLSGDVPTHAVVSMPKKKEENPLIAALRAKSEEALRKEESQPEEASKVKTSPRYAKGATIPTAKPVLTKPVMLAGLLAVVLVGMNAMSRANNGKGVMGGKAAESFASESLTTNPPKPAPAKAVEAPAPKVETPKTVPTEAKVTDKPLVETTAVEKPVPTKKVEPVAPKPVVVQPMAPKPQPRRIVRRKTAVRTHRAAPRKKAARKVAPAPRNSVRVYSPDGHPL